MIASTIAAVGLAIVIALVGIAKAIDRLADEVKNTRREL